MSAPWINLVACFPFLSDRAGYIYMAGDPDMEFVGVTLPAADLETLLDGAVALGDLEWRIRLEHDGAELTIYGGVARIEPTSEADFPFYFQATGNPPSDSGFSDPFVITALTGADTIYLGWWVDNNPDSIEIEEARLTIEFRAAIPVEGTIDDTLTAFAPVAGRLYDVSSVLLGDLAPMAGRLYDSAVTIANTQAGGTNIIAVGGEVLAEGLSEGVTMAGDALSGVIGQVLEQMALTGQGLSTAQVATLVLEALEIEDSPTGTLANTIAEAVLLTPTATNNLRLLTALIDAIGMTNTVGSTATAVTLVATVIAMTDVLGAAAQESVSESVTIDAALADTILAAANLLETLEVAATAPNTVTFVTAVGEAVTIGASTTTVATALTAVDETVTMLVRVALDQHVYVAWVMNTARKAPTTYTNFPFNSFAKIGGRYFAAADDGIYVLEGGNDDGAKINARIRTGLSNLGVDKLKAIPHMYVGYSTNGTLILKVINTTEQGKKVENWYTLHERPATDVRETRADLGLGVETVYAAVEIANKGGADFAIDVIRWAPMVFDRRI